MAGEQPALTPEYFRGVAEQLRKIAGKLQFDLTRQAQILALADGFERHAKRMEKLPATSP